MKNFIKNKKLQSPPLCNWFELLIILLIGWFVLSGIFERKFIIYGLLTCTIISLVCYQSFYMKGIHSDVYYFLIHVNPFRFAVYFLWLMKEIIKSSLSVTINVCKGGKSLHPQIVWFRADYDNPAARALLANSITLTPGTVTVDILEDGTYSVHALTEGAKEGLLDGTMQRKVASLFHEEIDYQVLEAEEVERSRKMVHLIETTFGRKGRMKRI
ncbi:MAG: Na+/H+ antiporter subunit E [Eubacteriales bacterium]|nr:Na+/H+ antiporter subunit E [Eubacteriales bacterium]